MDSTKLLTGTIAGTITSFITGFLIFGLALAGYMGENTAMKVEPNFVWLVVGHIIFAFLLTYIFLQWAGIKTVNGGLKAGLTIGLLIGLGYNAVLLGNSDLFTGGVVPAVIDAIGGAIIWAAGGAGVGWALGRGEGS